MKNTHLLPTPKPSRLHESGLFSSLGLSKEYLQWKFGKNIYITSDEEIKEGEYYITPNNTILKALGPMLINVEDYKKIILTTDSDLINDGIQAIDDDFLEWFVNNPSCEEVETKLVEFEVDMGLGESCVEYCSYYKLIIPKKEPKQETLEKAAENYAISKDSSSIFIKVHKKDFINGAKWQQEQMGNSKFLQKLRATLSDAEARRLIFETFKNK